MRLARKILLFSTLLLAGQTAFASHGMGGEITWWCNGTSYVFQMKFYRDCNGVPGPQSVTLSSNVPGATSIPMNKISQTDISPKGSNTSGIVPCPTCPSGGQGAVEEFIFQSNPVVLPGTPPATGWTFWWYSCCRSGSLTNVTNGGSFGFALRAKMYPYVGFTAGQCKDASPFFAEKPSTIICTGYPFTYNHNAIDPEIDSIAYAWDVLLDDGGSPPTTVVPFAPGYSVNSALPGPAQNPLNQAVTLNPISGEIKYLSYTAGYFATCIKASAYKCGTLAAEIWREINIVLIAGCAIPTVPQVPNNPPDVTVIDRKTNNPLPNNSFVVYAGDTVKLRLNAVDTDPHPILGVQTVTFTATGSELSATYTNPNTGCYLPPCATTSLPLPLSAPYGTQLLFDWHVTCGHLGFDTVCTHVSNVYNFVIKVNDDFCQANAIDVTTLSITVTRPPKLLPPTIKCVDVDCGTGSVDLTWNPPSPRDTFNTFAQYEIYGALAQAGPWIKLDSVYGSLSEYYTVNRFLPAAKLQALLGATANSQSLYFKMHTRCGCDSDSLSDPSNIARSMFVGAAAQPNGTVNVSWNPVQNPLLTSSNTKYYIYKEFPLGTWTLIDSTTHPVTSYIDSSTMTICDDSVGYKIRTTDFGPPAGGCESWSSCVREHVVNPAPQATIAPANPWLCSGGSVTLTANAGGSTYQWSGAATGNTQSINATVSGTYTVTVTYNPGGCTSTTSTTVNIATPCTPTFTGTTAICAGLSTNLTIGCVGGAGPQPSSYTYNYTINGSPAPGGPFTAASLPITITVTPGTTTTYQLTSLTANYTVQGITCVCAGLPGPVTVTVNPVPSATISGTASICEGQSTTITVNFAGSGGPFYYTYNPGGIAVGPVGNPHTFSVSPSATTNYTLVGVSNAFCTGSVSGNANITVNKLPQASVTGTTSICDGQSASLTVTFANAPGPYNFTYNPGAVSVTGATSPHVINVTPGSTTTYTLIGVSNANCTGTITGVPATVTVNTLPQATLSGTQDICAGQSANLTVTFANAPGPYNFTYNPGGVPVVNATSPYTITVSPGATTNYTLVGVSNTFCTGNVAGNANVTVVPLPTAQLSGTTTICDGQSTTLNIAFTGTGPWTYSYLENGNPVGPFTSAVSPAVITVSPSTTTTYTLPGTITDAKCTGSNTSGTATVTVTPLPTASITGNATICNGQSTNLTVTFTGQAPFTYSWIDVTNNVTTGPLSTNNTSVTIPVSPTATNTYQLVGPVNGAGCDGAVSGNVTVTVNQLPSAALTGTDTICDGQSTNLTVAFSNAPAPYTYNYTINGTPAPGGPFTANGATAVIPVSPNATTTYALASVSNINCPGSVTGSAATVTVTPLPTATMSGTTAICDGQSTNLTIAFTGQAPYTYSYLQGATLMGPFNTNNASVTIPVSPASTTTYSLPATVTGNGCAGGTSGNAVITVHPLPTATAAGTPEICVGQQASFTIAFTGTGPYTYSYSNGTSTFGPFTTPNNPETVTVSPVSTQTYTVTSVSDVNCMGSSSGQATVTVFPLPTAAISGTQTICDGAVANLTINFTGTGPFTYSYSDGTSTFGPFSTPNASVTIPVTPSANTTYTAVSVDDVNCTGTVSGQAVVSVTPLPTAAISGNPVICDGQSTTLSVAFTGQAPFTYSYTDGIGTFGPFTTSQNPVTLTVSPTATTTYGLTATVTGNGCDGTTSGTATVTVHPLPTAVVSGTPTICDGEQTTFTITFTGTPPFDYTYTDGTSMFGPFTANGVTETIAVSPSVSTTYTVTLVNDVNCTGTASGQAFVTVHPLPTAALTGTADICLNTGTNLSLSFTGTGPFTYSYSDGSQTFGPFVTSNNPEIIPVQPGVTTTYSPVAVSDANCVGSTSGQATVTVHELPTAAISDDSEICYGESTLIKVTFTGVAPFTYEYGNGTQVFGPSTTSNNPALITVSPATSSVYSLVSVTDNWCAGSVSGTAAVTVNPLPTPDVTGIDEICDGETTTFTTGIYPSYLWSNGETTQSITIGTAGNYVVTVTDPKGCKNTASLLLVVNQTPVVSFTYDTALSCETVAINLINTSTYPAGSVFYWDLGDGFTSNAMSPSHVFPDSGVYTVSLAILTQAGCYDSLAQDVVAIYYPLPVADFTLDPEEASLFNSRITFTDKSQHAVAWEWDFGNRFTSTEQNPFTYYDEPGRHVITLTVTNVTGCVSRFQREVYITPFFVPNAFTPNGDGLNEEFFDIPYIMDVSNYSMSVFNRWGQKVYENDNVGKPWRGLDRNGNKAPEGTYVYAIKVLTRTGKEYYYSGALNLIR